MKTSLIIFISALVGFVFGCYWQGRKHRLELRDVRNQLKSSTDDLEQAVKQNQPKQKE